MHSSNSYNRCNSAQCEELKLWSQKTWVWVLALTFTSYAILASDLSLSLPSLKQKHDTKYFTRCSRNYEIMFIKSFVNHRALYKFYSK